MSVVIMRIRVDLACAVWAQETEDFALLHGEGNVVDSGEIAVFFDDVIDFNRIGSVGGNRAAHAHLGRRNTAVGVE